MTVAQLKLFAIRARINRMFDHPALSIINVSDGTKYDILRILNAEVSDDQLRQIEVAIQKSAYE